jgi:hypothetical protein
MAVIGWFCLLIGVWNFIVPSLMPFDRSPFKLPPNYPGFSLALFFLLGALFFLSSRGIRNRESWGKGLGQAAVLLLVAMILGLLAKVFTGTSFHFSVGRLGKTLHLAQQNSRIRSFVMVSAAPHPHIFQGTL